MLTKEQDKQATRLRDAGVPGDIAVFLASRSYKSSGFVSIGEAPINDAAWAHFMWMNQPEGYQWWDSFDDAFKEECEARGIK